MDEIIARGYHHVDNGGIMVTVSGNGRVNIDMRSHGFGGDFTFDVSGHGSNSVEALKMLAATFTDAVSKMEEYNKRQSEVNDDV